MKRHEKAIINSIEDGRSMSKQEFSLYLDKYGSDILDIIFDYINKKLDDYTGSSPLQDMDVAFHI